MTLGRYPSQGENKLIARIDIERALTRWRSYVAKWGEKAPAGVRGYAGLDVAEMGKDQNVFFPCYGTFVAQPRSWGGVDPVKTTERAAALCDELDVDVVYVDATGVGAGVAPGLELHNIEAYGIKSSNRATKKSPLGSFERIRDQLLWEVREYLRTDDAATLPPCELLIEELSVLTYKIENGVIKVMKKDVIRELIGRSPDHLDSFALTRKNDGQLPGENPSSPLLKAVNSRGV
jgi:hypothetical protein